MKSEEGIVIVFRKPIVTSAKAMKLGSKSRDVESFVDQLKSEGENVAPSSQLSVKPTAAKLTSATPAINTEKLVLIII